MQYIPECIKAIGSAIGGIAGAWAVTMCLCNGIKMLCATWLVGEADAITPEQATEMMKIEPVWQLKNTKDAVAKMKNKW
ncbi:MAG: hypothetical protein IJZ62_05970 [Clostridia bacterium]|nr:hypothetical protein [Clostridia bacterium]